MSLRVPAPVVIARRRVPWWIPVSAVVAVLLMVLVGVLLKNRGDDAGTGGSGPVAQPEPEPPPAAPVLNFTGTTAYVDLGQPLSLEITGPITLEAWVRPTGSRGVQNIVARGFVTNPSGEIFLRLLGATTRPARSWRGSRSAARWAPCPCRT